MSINDNQWPPASAGANIPTAQALAEEKAFQEKYPKRNQYYELAVPLEYLYLLGAKHAGAAYFAILNILDDATTVGNGHCCLTEAGAMIGVSALVKARYAYFREQTKGDQTALYGFSIDYIIGEYKKAIDRGYDYVRFYNGINAKGQNTVNFGFRKEGSEQIDGISSRGNGPFLCPPLCPPGSN